MEFKAKTVETTKNLGVAGLRVESQIRGLPNINQKCQPVSRNWYEIYGCI